MMRRALVLGGGGFVGLAWQIGLVAGFLEAGVDLAGAGDVVGTSAGSIVGAWLASGRDPAAEAARVFSGDAGAKLGPDSAPDLAHLARTFARWSAIDEYTPAAGREVGALALTAPTAPEPAWVEMMAAYVGEGAIPDALRITAVDAESGRIQIFDASHGVPIARAVAASCAVPGVFPTVEVAGRRYTDGSIPTGTHADLTLERSPDTVLVIAPFDMRTPGIGDLMQREREREIARVRGQGIAVVDIAPSATAWDAMGSNALDASRQVPAFEAGREQGRQDARLAGIEAWRG